MDRRTFLAGAGAALTLPTTAAASLPDPITTLPAEEVRRFWSFYHRAFSDEKHEAVLRYMREQGLRFPFRFKGMLPGPTPETRHQETLVDVTVHGMEPSEVGFQPSVRLVLSTPSIRGGAPFRF